MRYICTSLGCKREFEKASHRNQHEKDAHKSEPAQVSQEPIAVMWQHEETGNTGFVDMSQVENRFFKHNPRLKQVCFCYSASPDYEALKAALTRCRNFADTQNHSVNKYHAENEALKLRVAELEKKASGIEPKQK